jgi:hypothetical protein
MQEVLGSNHIGDIAFFGGKACSTVTYLMATKQNMEGIIWVGCVHSHYLISYTVVVLSAIYSCSLMCLTEVLGSNHIGDIAFFGGKACSTVTYLMATPIAQNG